MLRVCPHLGGDETFLEKEPLENLARDGQLMAFRHHRFWQPMDTLRDRNHLEKLVQSGSAPGEVWD